MLIIGQMELPLNYRESAVIVRYFVSFLLISSQVIVAGPWAPFSPVGGVAMFCPDAPQRNKAQNRNVAGRARRGMTEQYLTEQNQKIAAVLALQEAQVNQKVLKSALLEKGQVLATACKSNG